MADTDFTPLIVSDGKGVWDQEYPNTDSPPISAGFFGTAEQKGEAEVNRLLEGPTESAYSDSFGASLWRSYLAGNADAYGATVTPDELHEPSPPITIGEARERYVPADVRDKLPVFEGQDTDQIPTKLAEQIAKYKIGQFESQQNAARFAQGHSWPVNFANDFVAGLMDPLNDAVMIGTGMMGGIGAGLWGLGESVLGRIAASGLSGAALGAGQGVALEGMRAAIETDWNIRDAVHDVVWSAVYGGAGSLLHSSIGAGFKYLKGKADDIAPTDRPAAVQMAPVITADAQTRNVASKTATAQLLTGRPVDVEGFFPAAPKTETAIGNLGGLLMDHPFMPRETPALAADQLDRDQIARQLEPEMFNRYDDLADRRDRLSGWYSDLKRQADEAAQAHETELEDLQYRLPRARQKNLAKSIQARLDELQQNGPQGPTTADLAKVQGDMLKADYAMRDMSPAVSDAYRRADEMIARAKLVETGTYMDQVRARQNAFISPAAYRALQAMIERDAQWRKVGALPGQTLSDATAAIREVDDAQKAAPPAVQEPNAPPAGYANPEKFAATEVAATTGEGNAEAKPAIPASSEIQRQRGVGYMEASRIRDQMLAEQGAAAPPVDMTGMLPEERAELEASQAAVAKADLMAQLYEQAASCMIRGGG